MWKKLTKCLVQIYTKENFSLKLQLQLSKLKMQTSFSAYINELKHHSLPISMN